MEIALGIAGDLVGFGDSVEFEMCWIGGIRSVGYLGYVREMDGLDICMCFTIGYIGDLVGLG